MTRVRRLVVASLLSLTLGGQVLAAWNTGLWTSPCWFDAKENPATVEANTLSRHEDYCTLVGIKLVYRQCAGCTSYAAYDYDGMLAVLNFPDSYVFLGAFAKGFDDGTESPWHSW